MTGQRAGVRDEDPVEWLESDDTTHEATDAYEQLKSLGIQGVTVFFNQQFEVRGARMAENLLNVMEQAREAD